ncbi:hypothetical protein [Parabacteroides gordonii]|jgi:hypothetical protein|uniref:hypothetical protein n=1 Tax=Parabacteroides gordonii TaxID=574930 RepID=UPI00241D5449|nr:hypothetical protein [Parabacteroides gordonii]
MEDTQSLDEVVVVGFGTQKKINLTGSVGLQRIKDYRDGKSDVTMIPNPSNPAYWMDPYSSGSANQDWYNTVFGHWAFSQEHNFSLNGGNEKKRISGTSILVYGANDSKSNVSDPALSMYLRPQEVAANSLIMRQGGFKWAMAHYLSPIAIQNFLNTSADGSSVETSPIYQNPGWPTMPNLGAESL